MKEIMKMSQTKIHQKMKSKISFFLVRKTCSGITKSGTTTNLSSICKFQKIYAESREKKQSKPIQDRPK